MEKPDVKHPGSRKPVPRAPAKTPNHKNELLDEGLDETFPASDPPAVDITRIDQDKPAAD